MESKHQGNIVHTMQLGNTTIHICDDYFARTPEKVEQVLDDLHAAGWAIIQSLSRREGEHLEKKAKLSRKSSPPGS